MKRKYVPKDKLYRLYYEQGWSQKKCAEHFDVSPMTIKHRMDEYGFESEPRGVHKGHVDRDELYRLYVTKDLSMKEVGEQLDRAPSNILADLLHYGFETKSTVARESRRGLYSYNRHFFDEWSLEMAWVLGLLFADGCVSQSSRYSYHCHLNSKDVDLLEQVRCLLSSKAPIKRYKNQSTSQLRVANGSACSLLVDKYGLIPNKSRTMQWPSPPADILSHFSRGLWDGDGSISRQGNSFQLTYTTGSKNFAEDFLAAISEAVNIFPKLAQYQGQYKPYWRIVVSASDSKKLIPWLYIGSTSKTRLARKFVKCKDFIRP